MSDIELYVMGEFDGDRAALEQAIADDPALTALAAREAQLELLLRDAAAEATFCPACGDLVGGPRCDACGAAVEPGGYVVERVLVSNAHGRMYVAHDADGKRVALKELAFVQSPTLEVIAAFEREAKLLRALAHPAIPRFVASFEEGTGVHARYYLAQELVGGVALDRRLDDHFYDETEILDIARQVLDVLVYLQSLSPMVIHRDIKPANLLLRDDGKIAVVDFGAAHVQGTTAGSTSIGTFGYMPIEQLAGQVDATTDPYALGASLLHLLSRREPWRIHQGASLDGINVSTPVRDFLSKLVAPEPAHRFASAGAARSALDKVARGESVVDDVAVMRARKARRRWWPIAAAVAATAVAVAGGAAAHALLASGHASDDAVVPPPPAVGVLRVELQGAEAAELFVDGRREATVHSQMEVAILPGRRMVRLIAATGQRCEQSLGIQPGKTTTVTCQLAPVTPPAPVTDKIGPGPKIDLDVKWAALHDVLRMLGDQCGLNLAVPDTVDARITVKLEDAPCDQALEVLLESHGLWYHYDKAGNIVRVAPRIELDRDMAGASERAKLGFTDDALPDGPEIDLDVKAAPLQDMLRMLAQAAKLNIVVPDTIDGGKVTLRLKHASWGASLKAILATHGLWYRYRPNGKLLRVAPRIELDREAAAERERERR